MEHKRYRWTQAMYDVPFVCAAVGSTRLAGPSLIALLAGLGRAESASRNLLTRMADMGALDVERHGRTNVYSLGASSTPRYRELEGTAEKAQWSGSFDALLYAVPERDRTVRDKLLHRARITGYGLLRPGVLIAGTPHAERLALDANDYGDAAWIEYTSITPTDLDAARRMADRAWDLTALATWYREGISRTTGISPVAADWDTCVRYRDLCADLYQPQLNDPHLPSELLPDDWPAEKFQAALAKLNQRVGRTIHPLMRSTAESADPDGHNAYYPPPWL